MRTIDLVRHADAGSRKSWQGAPDRERPLSEKGKRQAAALARELDVVPAPTAILSSPFVRCVQTVVPLAAAVGVEIEEEASLAERAALPALTRAEEEAAAWFAGRALGALDRLLARLDADGRGVVCSHGDVVPAVLAALHGRDDLPIEDLHLRKGAWCRLTFDDVGRAVAAERRPPPALDPA